jgi:transposase InsO family protein
VKRLRQLGQENGRLKKMVADRDLEIEAKVSIEAWRRHYNDVRPHSSLGYLTLAAFKAKHLLNKAPRSVVRTDDIL